MKLYTKKGDNGWTRLYDGKILDKNHEIFQLLGKIDECNVQIGRLRINSDNNNILLSIQKFLMNISSYIATIDTSKFLSLPEISLTVEEIEKLIDDYDSKCNSLTGFIIPGTCEQEINAHQCRVLIREIERLYISHINSEILIVKGKIKPKLESFLPILNRLSDFFFVYARVFSVLNCKTEILLENL